MTPKTLQRAMLACLGLGAVDVLVLNALVLPALQGPGQLATSAARAVQLPAARAAASSEESGRARPTDRGPVVDGEPSLASRDDHTLTEAAVVSASAAGVASQDHASPALAALTDTVVKPRPLLVLEFDTSSYRVDHKARALIRANLRELSRARKLVLVGHADASGPLALNDQLSRERALSVARRLGALGLERARIQIEGRGASEPSLDGRDRRVEIYLGDAP